MPSACDSSIEDIEDMVSASDPTPQDRQSARKSVVPRARKRKEQLINEELQADSVIPGTQKIWMRTWGCSHNNSDGEYMAGQLAASGYRMTDDPSEADLWLLNSCTVKNPAEDHFRNSIKKAQEQQKKVVVAGCVPQAQPRMDYLKGLSIIGVQQIDRVVEVVDEAVKGHSVRLLGQKKDGGKRLGGARLDLPKIRKNPLIEIISINTGCLNACTYCKTKHARGDLASYPIDELVERARQSFQEGVCEIWLTSEDTGAYGRDIGTDLPSLLWKLVEVIPEGAMLRLGMTNPPYILEHLEEMAKILSHPRVYAFLHIPVQSASDSVLMDMKREYCVDDFKRVVDFLKERRCNAFFKKCNGLGSFGVITYAPAAAGSRAESVLDAEMDWVQEKFEQSTTDPSETLTGRRSRRNKKQRTKELSQLFHSYNPYDHKVGERQHVLVTEKSFDAQYYVAHNKFYEQVLVPKRLAFKGKMIEVDIYEAGKHFLKGQPVDDCEPFTPSIATPLQNGQVSGLTQEQTAILANGLRGPASTPSSSGSFLIGSYSLDREGLKMLGMGLALTAAILAFILEKLY
ncbi:threonylcarbamoyladenosine tRNA methylthiotransferase [Lampris incognitus]|uniref:threonylcarbamoyladenosine tRNA methylthiotransferase n=1 Tax=Lampris incognitus TaxID=2546036 RepID=UPI0024B49FB6|nr:threonylcarbamoyladenosine tRNA methylthiotransferase [Lampris incognitus]